MDKDTRWVYSTAAPYFSQRDTSLNRTLQAIFEDVLFSGVLKGLHDGEKSESKREQVSGCT